MKKEKVLIVHNYYKIPGGEDTVVENEKKILEANGHDVKLYSRNNRELDSMGIFKKLLMPFFTIFNIKTYIDVKRIIKKESIDIIHVHNTLNIISPSVYYAALKCKVPVVQTVHNFRLLCPAATFYRNGHVCEECVNKGLNSSIKYSCYRNNRIYTLACVLTLKIHRFIGIYKRINYICLTDFNKEKLIMLDKFIDKKRVYIKQNFVIENSICHINKERKNQFVFAGRLDSIKGIDILLKAWRNVNCNVGDLVICGTGPMLEWCNDFIKVNKLENVKMLGFVENNLVRKIISESKALILPTQWYEGFPMAIVEAYSGGTPVIGSDIGNTGSLIINNLTGMKFKANSIDELTSIINSFDKVKDELKVFDFYRKNYSYNENYNIMKKIYTECLNK